jgi:hypothetical protein
VEGGPSENGPVWEFQHKQPDGSVFKHEGEFVCAEDLVGLLKSREIDGRCYSIQCKAKLYPEELIGIVTPEFYEIYRKLFNSKNKVGGGIPQSSILRPVDLDKTTCAPPPKSNKAGNRRTYGKKRKTIKKNRKTLKRRAK